MKTFAVIAIVALMATGCRKAPVVVNVVQTSVVTDHQAGIIPTNPIPACRCSIDLSNDFRKEISPGITLVVGSRKTGLTHIFPSGVEFDDVLVQKDGSRIYFSCDAVADKILDRDLAPIVERQCVILHKAAMDYWTRTPPTAFRDDKGMIWVIKFN